MNREVLHRFFMGNVTVQEGMAIKAWVERSEENKRTFIKGGCVKTKMTTLQSYRL